MIGRLASTDEGHANRSVDAWSRPLPMQVTGWVFLVGAALLILGGAYREQSNMITSGLLFLAMGMAFAPGTLRKGWPLRVALGALAIVGAIYTFVT